MLRGEEQMSVNKKSFSVSLSDMETHSNLFNSALYYVRSVKKKKKKRGGAWSGKDELFSALMKVRRAKFALQNGYVPQRGSSLSDSGQTE